jgi:hypothetical protein
MAFCQDEDTASSACHQPVDTPARNRGTDQGIHLPQRPASSVTPDRAHGSADNDIGLPVVRFIAEFAGLRWRLRSADSGLGNHRYEPLLAPALSAG